MRVSASLCSSASVAATPSENSNAHWPVAHGLSAIQRLDEVPAPPCTRALSSGRRPVDQLVVAFAERGNRNHAAITLDLRGDDDDFDQPGRIRPAWPRRWRAAACGPCATHSSHTAFMPAKCSMSAMKIWHIRMRVLSLPASASRRSMWPSTSRVWPAMSCVVVFGDLAGQVHGAVVDGDFGQASCQRADV